MHIIEQKILNKFKKEPFREISTTELVRDSHPEEYARIMIELKSELSDKRALKAAKRRKGQLHRKILYHLNSLVGERILKVSSLRGKGEKLFSLAIDEGELTIEKRHKQIVITKPVISTSLIDEYEKLGVIHKYDPENWMGKLNCILLESSNQEGINKFYDLVYNCFSEVNDCLGLNNFEHQINSNSSENIKDILKRMDLDTKDHERHLSLILDLKNISDDAKMTDFIDSYTTMKPKNISLIFKSETKDLKEHSHLFRKISADFSREEIKINLHNRKVHSAPIIIGKAGPYTIRDEEWHAYETEIKGKTIGLAIASTSIAIDINRFFRENLSTSDFREMIKRTAKTLLRLSVTQRRKANEYFRRLNELNKPNTKKFFTCQKEYIRFWNFDLRDNRQEHLLDLIEGIKLELKNFCETERAIYNACGMPISFDIVFSSVFNKFNNNLSTRNYMKTTVRSFREYESNDVSLLITMKERLAKIFEGGDRIRFFRKGELKPDDLLKEATFLMNSYELPLITYDFRERKGEIKLTNFMTNQKE